jgi:hypothetical protein
VTTKLIFFVPMTKNERKMSQAQRTRSEKFWWRHFGWRGTTNCRSIDFFLREHDWRMREEKNLLRAIYY